jgi:hypothetical protein
MKLTPNVERILWGAVGERAIRETFGETTTFAKVEEARRLYARNRTDDLLNSLRDEEPDNNAKLQPWI